VNRGIWYGVAAYSVWGIFPLYWRLLGHVPSLEVLGHRIVWSSVVLVGVLLVARGRSAWLSLSRAVFARYALAAVLIAINWLVYIHGVNSGLVVEVSLGYFITPLVNVLLGVLVLGERLRRLQWIAVGLAAVGVAHLTRAYGAVPWIACGLALSFGNYGLVKKGAPLGSLEGLTLETTILFLPAAAYVSLLQGSGGGAFLDSPATDLLLVGGGLITIGPLLLFASSVQRIPLSIVGILQYISPTISFLLGVFVFGEPFSATQFVGFSIVWAALLLFALDGISASRA
jgi:chloramphenicol-sensitive protein RarD